MPHAWRMGHTCVSISAAAAGSGKQHILSTVHPGALPGARAWMEQAT